MFASSRFIAPPRGQRLFRYNQARVRPGLLAPGGQAPDSPGCRTFCRRRAEPFNRQENGMSDRNTNGTFALGNRCGPGRPPRGVERQYLAAFAETVSPSDWREIIARAVADAKAGDARARDWLSKYLVGDDPFALVKLADELASLKAELGVRNEGGDVAAGVGEPAANGAG